MKVCHCQCCGDPFVPQWDDALADYVSLKLCYHCFEDSVEDYEEHHRERIARQNEY